MDETNVIWATTYLPLMDKTNEGEDFERYRGPNNDICHDKINSILEKVLKKLQMSQDVQMKAYQIVEEVLTEREIEGVTTTETPF